MFDDAPEPPRREAKRKREEAPSDKMPPWVTIVTPEGMTMKVKSSLDFKAPICVPVDATVFGHIRQGILAEKHVIIPTHKNVQWRAERNSFIANRKVAKDGNDIVVYKGFRPDGKDEASMAKAFEDAVAWLTATAEPTADE